MRAPIWTNSQISNNDPPKVYKDIFSNSDDVRISIHL